MTDEQKKSEERIEPENNSTELIQEQNNIEQIEDQIDLEVLRSYQNFPFAIIGGLLVTIVSAVIWAIITVATKYQIGYMAIAVGFLVGMAVRFFGAGIDQKFGILGAVLSLVGCLLGNLLSQIGFIAHEYSYSYLEVLSMLDFSIVKDVMIESFSPMDILFYGIAIYEGYRFSFRNITPEVIKNKGNSSSFKLRVPLAVLSVVVLIIAYFIITRGHSGEKIYKYDSGEIMSEGKLKNSKYDGAWTFYHKNGNILSTGFFYEDVRDGTWQWYDEEGSLEMTGTYQRGIESGTWKIYYATGAVYDSVAYNKGRKNGEYISKYENGNTYEIGNYKNDAKEGPWKMYYENGQLWKEGEMKNNEYFGKWLIYSENGQLLEDLFYDEENNLFVNNRWDDNANWLIKEGNGDYIVYGEDKETILARGKIKDGKKEGIWKYYFDNGELREEASFDNDVYKIIHSWNSKGNQVVTNGEGTYFSFWEGTDALYETGLVANGLKEGLWQSYDPNGSLQSHVNYSAGKLNGKYKAYYPLGDLSFEGEYINDSKNGEWVWYNENGTISSSIQFKNDKKEGTQIINDLSGNTVRKEVYKNGDLVDVKAMY